MAETRAEKAQRLVDEGAVRLLKRCGLYTTARVTSGHNTYYVTLYANGAFFCACLFGRYNSHTDDLCAHALAVKLAVERKEP